MLYNNDRNQMRQFFFTIWKKALNDQPLEPMEEIISGVIQQHPEYHQLLNDEEKALERDYLPEGGESNPFLHMGMHIAIQEQLSTNRPAGIAEVYRALRLKYSDGHKAEHQMIEHLAEMLWQAQKNNALPDESAYMNKLQQLIQS